ncbi:MAG: hypothetical protein ACKVT2_18290 [Saprospiraceae bacterium]
MKNLIFLLLACIVCFFSFGCPKPVPVPVKFSLDNPFSLQVGQIGELKEDQSFTIKFEKVGADSRCPVGVECITAGKAEVVLTLTKGAETQTVTLPFTMTNGTSNVTDFKGHTIRVLGVAPIKFKDKEINPNEYTIIVKVTESLPPIPQVKIGEPFTLAMGGSLATPDDYSGVIRFDSVVGDSRCPEGVKCIWAGRADAAFSFTRERQTQSILLASGDLSKGGKGEAQLGAYTLKINTILPAKGQVPIPQQDYKAVLILLKQGG